MTLAELVGSYAGRRMAFADDEDSEFEVKLGEPVSPERIEELAALWPIEMPEEYRELLALCREIVGGPLESLEFDLEPELDIGDLVPCGIRIATDGFGNDWVLEFDMGAKTVGPIWYCCHDAPVFLHQSDTLAEFIVETFKMCTEGERSLVDIVHDDKMFDVWQNDPGLVTAGDARHSTDVDLRAFAESLEEDFLICDLRDAKPGDGFSWGKAVPGSVCRYGSLRLFGFRKRKSLLSRLFGGKGK